MAKLKDTDLMPFGKYKGTAMANVPPSYLMWAFNKWTLTPTTKDILGYIKENLDVIKKELKDEETEILKNAKHF
jgi:uncharacterized protein (DUF3820 family)